MIDSRILERKIGVDDTMLKALNQMDRLHVKMLFVFSEERFISILTLGDIQRAIIKHISMDAPIASIITLLKDKIYANSSDSEDSIKEQIHKTRTECMPVLDSDGNLVKVYFWNDFYGTPPMPPERAKIALPVVIMAETAADSLAIVSNMAKRMKDNGNNIRVYLDESEFMEICYDESIMIKRMASYPYILLGVALIFAVVALIALTSSKRAEQNKVWVGLSKETAHQLGTPISSLMAWTQVLHETYPDDELLPEMDKDVKRLQMIAERFSKIGSQPELRPENLNDVVAHVVDYIGRRTSNRVNITTFLPAQPPYANLSVQLFEWVVENLCKNAVDAMDGQGDITISIIEETTRFAIEVADTGKGIPKNQWSSIFQPGFTTKKRGWGLGLSLAKRIVEEYHRGRIFVKNSEVGKGTTFRIELKKK